MYDLDGGDDWVNNLNWKTAANPCTWFGITCNDLGQVTIIDLDNNNLKGPFPTSICQPSVFPAIISINLGNNILQGEMPQCDLSPIISTRQGGTLRSFSIENNDLSGDFPWENYVDFSGFTLNIYDNRFTGLVPESFCDISNADISGNRFSCPFPSCCNDGANTECGICVSFPPPPFFLPPPSSAGGQVMVWSVGVVFSLIISLALSF